MIIIAKTDGWEKRIEVEPYIMTRGYIEIAFNPPMSVLVYDQQDIKNNTISAINAIFHFTGYNNVGTPVFTFEG